MLEAFPVLDSLLKAKGEGGWRPRRDADDGLFDMSYVRCPLQFLPPGAQPGKNSARGNINLCYDDMVQRTLPDGEERLAEATGIELVKIPASGFTATPLISRGGRDGTAVIGYSVVYVLPGVFR